MIAFIIYKGFSNEQNWIALFPLASGICLWTNDSTQRKKWIWNFFVVLAAIPVQNLLRYSVDVEKKQFRNNCGVSVKQEMQLKTPEV